MIEASKTKQGKFSRLSALGFSVFPLPRGSKVPNIKWSQYQVALPAEEDVRLWDSGNYNVGIVCGAISDLLVVDVDSAEGQEFIDALDLPDTPTVKTAKGRHYYFKNPDALVSNKVRLLGVPVDIRANGGYVVGPQSLHESGHIYAWEVSPEQVSFAELPDNLLSLLTVTKSHALVESKGPRSLASSANEGPISDYIEKQHRAGLEHLDNAKSGTRNDTLFRVAVGLANHVAAAGFDWEQLLGNEVTQLLISQSSFDRESGESQLMNNLAKRFEAAVIKEALKQTRGRRIDAALRLGIGRNTITRKIQELKLEES